MTIEEMKKRKQELGYTNEMLAERSGVPFGTVQKIFAGITKAPRYDTIQKLKKALEPSGDYTMDEEPISEVAETAYVYGALSGSLTGNNKSNENKLPIKRRKIKIGMFEGKYKMPPEELFYNDDISDEFEGVFSDMEEV